MSVTYLTIEQDWSKGLSDTHTLPELREFIASWKPFVNDAQQVVDGMDEESWLAWTDGLFMERNGQFAGEEFAVRYGAILMPENLIRGSEIAMHFKVPLGVALIRLHEEGLLV